MLKSLILTVLFFLGIAVIAQETEGYLQYTIDVQAVDTSMAAKQQAGLLRNSKMEIYFMPDFTRMDFKMGQLYDITAVVDLKAEKAINLVNSPMGKFATRVHTSSQDTSQVAMDSSATIELIDEEKVILGYRCKKAILKSGESETTYWYTDEIDIDLKGQQMVNNTIPGFPLEFYSLADGVLMHFKASNIEFSLDGKKEGLFSTKIPAGYTVMQDVD